MNINSTIDADEILAFRKEGFRILRRALPLATLEAVRRDLRRVEREMAARETLPPGVELARMEDGERRACRVEPVIAHSPVVEAFARSSAVMALAASFLEQPVHLLEDKLIYKPPRCLDTYPPHQEWWWTQAHSWKNLMLVIPLERCTRENGPLFVVPGSHQEGLLSHLEDVIPEDQFDRDRAVPLLLEVGDVAVVSGGVVHFSAENRSEDQPRTLLLLSYNSQDEGDQYWQHRNTWTQATADASPS